MSVKTLETTSKIVEKYVYVYGNHMAEGNSEMKELLGGKGANLAEMSRIGIPVPPGFTLTTEITSLYDELGKEATFKKIRSQVRRGVNWTEKVMGKNFGDPDNPLLLSVRSGARVSMPGMMDTVLNLGLNKETVDALAEKNPRFAWDSYRRLVQMYGDVVMGLKPENKEDEDPFEVIIDALKKERGVTDDLQLDAGDLEELVYRFKAKIKEKTGLDFPEDPWEQLWGAIEAVLKSWNNERARVYRTINNIPDTWGTAINVQAMVYGNLNGQSATGVAFTRDAATGENLFNGEFLFNAQGEDVVAGVRTPLQISKEGSVRWAELAGVSEYERQKKYASLEEAMPEIYQELFGFQQHLERHYHDMQDLEFTIEEGRLWLLQTRGGKRTGTAMVKIAMDMLEEGLIDEETVLMRVDPVRLDDLLHPVFDQQALIEAQSIAKGLPASPGAATGQVVFFADEAVEWTAEKKDVILVRQETSPEDLKGMNAAKGILTSRGGMTSHAAVVARGMGKCCVSGAGLINVDYRKRQFTVNGLTIKEGDWISIDGSTGDVYQGKIKTILPEVGGTFAGLMSLADKYTRMLVRTNADTPEDAKTAREFGAKGIGLCRTEHMFFEGKRINAIREMILAESEEARRKALDKLLPMQRSDFEAIFETMKDLPVTIRLLDPPLHEFLPQEKDAKLEMSKEMSISMGVLNDKIALLHEANPMLGHRGCRLGITYPEITEMQTRAIIEAALNVKRRGIGVFPEIMVPLIGRLREFEYEERIIRRVAEAIFKERGETIDYKIGTMIEIPRAALTADLIASRAQFFSFGTNDLTQMTFGFSRDDIGKFLPIYLREGIMDFDPFARIDENGVGRLVQDASTKGRSVRKDLKLGICGEHGGNPESIDFCERVGLDYVSCSPYRVPIARLAAAQAAIRSRMIALKDVDDNL